MFVDDENKIARVTNYEKHGKLTEDFINIIAFIMYGIDKWKAHRKQWRISEKMLLFLAVIGGSAGALAGMYIFHHKTLHKKFTIGVPLILVIQVMIFICIMENFYR